MPAAKTPLTNAPCREGVKRVFSEREVLSVRVTSSERYAPCTDGTEPRCRKALQGRHGHAPCPGLGQDFGLFALGFFGASVPALGWSPSVDFSGQTENAGHFAQPTAIAMGHSVMAGLLFE